MATEIIMPKAGMTMEEGKIIRWLKNVGDKVEAGEGIIEIETDKITMESESPADGILLARFYEEGAVVPITTVIGYVGGEGEEVAPPANTVAAVSTETVFSIPQEENTAAPRGADDARPLATPYAKKLAAEGGVDISEITPGGAGGVIKAADVERKLKATKAAPLAGMRGAIAKRMHKSHLEIPPVTQNMKAYADELLSLRAKINENREQKITINDIIVKACAIAVAESDIFRTEINADKQELVTRAETNIGVAVSVDNGLLVPVVFCADKLSLFEISAKIKDLAARARSGKLRRGECEGSVFTISNMGAYGVFTFTPIINQPNAAILGVNCVNEELALVNGAVAVRKYIMLSLTFDHRIIDGAAAAVFQQRVKRLLEYPREMPLEKDIFG